MQGDVIGLVALDLELRIVAAGVVDAFRPWVLTMIELFGVERTIFGTNWPVDAVYASYLETVDAYRRILADAGFSRAEQTRMLKENAENRVLVKVLNAWIAPDPGVRLGFLLHAAGFVSK